MTNQLGLSSLRPGFAISHAMDRAFALGWPELYVLADSAFASLPTEAAGRRWVWTREDAETKLSERDPLKAARDALNHGGRTANDALLLECIGGAEAVATAMVTALEELSANEWQRAHRGSVGLFGSLPFVMLRVDDPVAGALIARLEAIRAKRSGEGGPLEAPLAEWLETLTRPPSTAEARTERFTGYDRRNAARLAFLGASGVFDHWYEVGDARAQSYFLATAGQIAGAEIEAAVREGAYLSLIRDQALAWLGARGVPLPEPPAVPKPANLDSLVCGEADEFGFVFLPEAAAAQLTGEDDHTKLTEGVDPTSSEPTAVEAYGAKGFLFCRTYDVARCELESDGDGNADAFVAYGGNEELSRIAIAGAAERRWRKLTTVEGPLVGLPAGSRLADLEGGPFALPLKPGSYEVWTAMQTDEQGEELPPLLWLRKL